MKHFAITALAICLGTAAMAPVGALTANAAENSVDIQEPNYFAQTESEIQPRLFTQIVFDIRPSETTGYIEAEAKNTFTLFSSTVYVRVYLYSSTIRTTDRSQMTLEKMVVAPDLDQGQSLIAKASTNGEQKYWTGFMDYTVNGGDLKTGQTDTILFSADGTIIDIIDF